MAHKNSKIIYIRRTLGFTHEANSELTDWFGQAARDIGSYYKKGSKTPGSGLETYEVTLLMPKIVGVEANHPDFIKRVEEYFHEISTRVPEEGLMLEIGLGTNNDDIISPENLPINPEHYVKYKHALSHPSTAKNKELADGNQLVKWYIDDPEETTENARKKNKEEDEALAVYLSSKDNADIVDRILTNMAVDTRLEKDPVLKLKELAEKEPKKFVTVAKDPNLVAKYKINKMIQSNVLKRVGTRILITESGTEIGRDMTESILWLQDKENSATVSALIARHKEFAKSRNNKDSVEE